LGEIGRKRAEEIILELQELVTRYLGGKIFSSILNREDPVVEFDF
jgi:hypothetical protein